MVKTEIHEAAKIGDNELIKKLAKGLSVTEEDEVKFLLNSYLLYLN